MKTGFACGVFDIFHAGHVLMLKECKDHCDYLIVAVNRAENISEEVNPGKRKPLFAVEERKMVVASCRYVDEVLEYNSEDELYEILKSKKVDVRFLGDDYKGKNITGADLPLAIHYIDRSHGFSSTRIVEKIISNSKPR
jgi:glycerol-3-phosphate cytidylyltransferase